MLTIIEDEDERREAQDSLKRKMDEAKEKSGTIRASYKGGHSQLEVGWNKELGIWWGTKEDKNWYWNAFGTKEPDWNPVHGNTITCEINISVKGTGIIRSGAFARDLGGKVYLLHTGRIGGGRKGIGKDNFWNEFQGKSEEVDSRGTTTKFALVASLESPEFAKQVANFVHEVERIKAVLTRKT